MRPEPIGAPQQDYFNLLVSGFRKGSLALDVPVPPALINAENPWDPARRPGNVGMHDVSYNRGHYYLYFGVAPVVGLLWPFRVITGHDLPLSYALVFYSVGAFLLGSLLWLRIVRDHFPRVSYATRLAGMAAIGLAGGQLVLSRRPSMWELPIAAGYYYMVWMMVSGYMATRCRRPWAWMVVAGISLGLAFGSRPTLVGGGAGLAMLVVAVGYADFESGGIAGARRRAVKAAFAAGLPLLVIVGGLLEYNHARFGKYAEFGMNFQLTSLYEAKAKHFSLSFIPFNFLVYFLKAPQWGRYFPFLHPIMQPARAAGYYGIEYVYGALVVCPALWGVACAPALLRRRGVGLIAGVFAATGLATTLLLLSFNTASARYRVDFIPWWVWLAALGWAGAEDSLAGAGRLRTAAAAAVRVGYAACAFVSCVLAFCASAELYGILQFLNPGTYRTVARVMDSPTALAERLSGYKGGALEVDVVFPPQPSGSVEPLLVTGVGYEKDYVYFYYQSATGMRIGYVSSGQMAVAGPAFPIQPGKKYHFRIETGALYPPESVLFDQGVSVRTANLLKRWTRVAVDGVTVLRVRALWHEATPSSVEVGRDSSGATFGTRFTGTLTAMRRDRSGMNDIDTLPTGDVTMVVGMPDEVVAAVQPLASVGHVGRADILGLRMLDRRSAMLVYESWGGGEVETGPITLPDSGSLAFRMRFGPLLHDTTSPRAILGRTIAVWQDGKAVLWQRSMIPLDGNLNFDVMGNDVGSSMMIPTFHGRLDSFAREPDPPLWRYGPFASLDMELGGIGSGPEPLAALGTRGHSDTLAIRWLPQGRAQLLYEHTGSPLFEGPSFAWDATQSHRLSLRLPGFAVLDRSETKGASSRLRVAIDGAGVWDRDVPFFAAPSSTVAVGRNDASAPCAREALGCVVLDLSQSAE